VLSLAEIPKTADLGEQEQWDEVGDDTDMYPKAEAAIAGDGK
jgi:hypothetical protein